MAKFKVLKRFMDKEEKCLREPGSEIELTEARAKAIKDKLGDGFLEPVKEEVKEEPVKEPTKPKTNAKK